MFEGPDYERIAPLLDAHGWDAGFFQQHYRDTWVAEFAGSQTGVAALAMALAGLFLTVERRFDGRGVQLAHGRLARGHVPTSGLGWTASSRTRPPTDVFESQWRFAERQ